MSKARAHLLISGRVQGVFYRAFTREAASYLGLCGWVRNLPDGRVEAIFEGNREDIEEIINQCYSGPPGARVDNIDVSWEEYKGEFQDFGIRYY